MDSNLVYVYSAPFVAAVVVLEMTIDHFSETHHYKTRDTLVSMVFAAMSVAMEWSLKAAIVGGLGWVFQFRVVEIPLSAAYWLALLVAQDLAYYCCHVAEHRCRILWASHLSHHSSEQFNITTGFRASLFKTVYRYLFFLPLCLLGFEPLHILMMYVVGQVHGIFVHTQRIGRLGFLEKFMVTPSHHRVHHASNVPYLDKNMDQIFIIWDRLFGTFQPENDSPDEPIRFGLTQPLGAADSNFLKITFHEWSAIWRDCRQSNLSWAERFKYIFYEPGWSHDGSRKTTQMLQAELKNSTTHASKLFENSTKPLFKIQSDTKNFLSRKNFF